MVDGASWARCIQGSFPKPIPTTQDVLSLYADLVHHCTEQSVAFCYHLK